MTIFITPWGQYCYLVNPKWQQISEEAYTYLLHCELDLRRGRVLVCGSVGGAPLGSVVVGEEALLDLGMPRHAYLHRPQACVRLLIRI